MCVISVLVVSSTSTSGATGSVPSSLKTAAMLEVHRSAQLKAFILWGASSLIIL